MITAFIAVLIVSTLFMWFQGLLRERRDAQRSRDLKLIQKELIGYYSEQKQYPTTKDFPSVMGSIPTDPTGSAYTYVRVDSESYVLGACLEDSRTSDMESYSRADSETYEIGGGQLKCTCASLNSYCINQEL